MFRSNTEDINQSNLKNTRGIAYDMTLISDSAKGTLKALVHYDGVWDEHFNYSNYKMKGILIRENTTFEEIKELIVGILEVNSWETKMEIRFQLESNYQTLEIEDNVSLQFYIEMKKDEPRVTSFPLCVTTNKFEGQPQIQNINSEASIGIIKEQFVDTTSSSGTAIDIIKYAEILYNQTRKEDEEAESKPQEINIVTDPKITEIYVGQIFKDKKIMKTSFCFYTIANQFQYKVSKSCKREYIVICINEDCRWTVRASRDGKINMFVIRRMINIHTCPPNIRMDDKRQATASIIGEHIKMKFLDIKTIYTPADIIADIQRDFGIVLSYNRAWRSNVKALNQIRGSPRDSYSILPGYLHMLLQTNPGSVVDLHTTDENKFEYMFMALDASIKGWRYCRPIIVVDGTFLKSNYGGTLITASTQDGNGKIFPLAFAVVDSENDDSWEYFFFKLKEAFGGRNGLCIVSDRHLSILNGVKKVFPEASHAICMYHLLSNIKSKFKHDPDTLRDCFYGAARSYTTKGFDYYMKELDAINAGIRKYLTDIGIEKWARAHCKANRYSTMTSNIAESLNAAIKAARELPITTLLESLRCLMQEWSYANRNIAICTFTKLTNKAEHELRNHYASSLRMKASTSVRGLHSVEDGDKTFIVKLNERTCTCCRFQLDEMPCPHAIAILSKLHQEPYQYYSDFFTKENMLATYEGVVYPMPSQNNWDLPANVESVEVLPPIGAIPAGRPKKRITGPNEIKKTNQCGRCKQRGHNKKTCKNIPK
ncbi:uncharacterized protein LOC126657220 [Mercurialis annua]|uniref:uncharacterized protein LOC126657220 n=1 Tax=Mercurialis annua TaxID=3986 RepID=UPI0024AE36FE|nr:uncharacterized protein LOC126657220 [Mercurialis annua]